MGIDLPLIWALIRMIRNLVDNAIHYTPTGGTVTVRLVHEDDPSWLKLQVEDSGPGIAPGERDLVFRPFYRALGTNVDGSGLGLAIVRQIALNHGAQISVEDANLPGLNGPGARFTVRFAAAAPSGYVALGWSDALPGALPSAHPSPRIENA